MEDRVKQDVLKHNRVSSNEYISDASVDQGIQILLFLQYVQRSWLTKL